MGLLKSIFKGSTNGEIIEKKMNWIALNEESQLIKLISNSSNKPSLIFKHSTRCGISRMALKSFEKEYSIDQSEVDIYFLDLLNYRDLSNEIADRLKIQHQSPQVLVLKNETVVYSDSHYSINANTIKEILLK